jgi:hypothetical protein
LRRRWPGVSAGLSLLREDARRTPGRTSQLAQIKMAKKNTGQVPRGPSFSLPIVQLAATASKAPCGRRYAIGCADL